mgnify:CR=1 FL=1
MCEEDQIVANESKKQQYVSLKNRAKNNSRDIYKLLLELEGKILEEEEERSEAGAGERSQREKDTGGAETEGAGEEPRLLEA